MKIMVDNELVLDLNETKKKVLKSEISEDEFDQDMKRRIAWIIMYRYECSFKKLKEEWEPKLLANGVKAFPADPDEFAELVFRQPNYKCRKRQLEIS